MSIEKYTHTHTHNIHIMRYYKQIHLLALTISRWEIVGNLDSPYPFSYFSSYSQSMSLRTIVGQMWKWRLVIPSLGRLRDEHHHEDSDSQVF